VAVVTGASRGIGRGIVLGLAEAGATIYLTGRSTREGGPTVALSGTIEETAEAARALGGEAHAVACDHRDDPQVQAFFEHVAREQGRLDLLVNNVWGGYELLHAGEYETFARPFWQAPAALWDSMFLAGVRAHYVASTFAMPLMLSGGSGLIVNISSFAAANPKESVALGVAKSATDRMSLLMAEQVREHGIAVITLYPGLVRTEGILKWKEYIDLSNSESPQFVGRAIAALAADPRVLERSGEIAVAAELALEYGFTDLDGTRPQTLRPQYETLTKRGADP